MNGISVSPQPRQRAGQKTAQKWGDAVNPKGCCSALAMLCLMGLTNCSSGNNNHSNSNDVVPILSITATAGTPQSHAVNAAFGEPLVATVTANGAPASGVVVTFTAPATGPSGTFAGGVNTATTNASGVAMSSTFTANGAAGAYTVTAAVSGVRTLASFSLTNTTGAPAAIAATSGTPQSAAINAAFAVPLVATVVDSGQNPVSGAIVTFTAPASLASGIFADTTTNVTTAITNASGVATSAAFTANGTSGADTVTASVAGVSTPANFDLTNIAGAPAAITATSGTPQSAPINTAFAAPLVATVLDSGSNPVSAVVVTFRAPATQASGTFANGKTTEMDTTNASGMASSTTFSADGKTGGPYTVTATVAGVSAPANFSLTNRVASSTYVFYLSGQEAIGPNFYALAGSVEIEANGNVLAGEQDYNDGSVLTSPQPAGDRISGGKLTVDATTGQGTLTLKTNNTNVGVKGTETLGVQFVNSNHALIVQFDGTATSSGSMDLQKLPSALSGGYAFTLYGVDNSYEPVAFGGVFSISGGTTMENGLVDTNDFGTVTTGTVLSGTLSTPDSFGRGSITTTINYGGAAVTLNYYIVGLEAIRIIDVDATDSAIGSAFGQGANATTSSDVSLGSSVFGVEGSLFSLTYAFAGMLNTSSSSGAFSGVADDNELTNGILSQASQISGTYSIGSNGYGNLMITSANLGDVSALGIYITDPNLNLTDPNNTTSGLGGALVADMDATLAGGTGLMIPQADTSTASFAGKYAFAAQDNNSLSGSSGEFDFVGQGSVTGGVLTGIGLVSDPFFTLSSNATDSGVTFSGTPFADTNNVGRYTMLSTNAVPNPLDVTINAATTGFDVVIYQASGGQLFWLDEDTNGVFLGSLQQQGSFTGLPTARKASKTKPK
ncbi:MAG: hypothetical protein WB951_01470 [Candidatus Sulfotelmatobacter sp.]|jgi:hypothetical protein